MATGRTNIPTPTNTTMTIPRIPSLFTAAFLCALFAAPAGAQDFPSKPIRVIVPYAAGGGADILAPLVGQQLTARLKQPRLGENPGGPRHTIGQPAAPPPPKYR